MLRHLITGVAAFALISAADAQQKQQVATKKATTPQLAGTFHPTLGLIKPPANQPRSGPDSLYNNSNLSNYYSVPSQGQEWIDNFKLLDRNHDHADQVNGLQYTYCSADTNPNGVTQTINIYDDSVYCAGPTNWPNADCSYAINGLPGGNNGALACWIVSVDLWGVACDLTTDPNGNRLHGWGQIWDNSTTGPWIANGGLGQSDSFTWFDPAAANGNSFMGCYWFGGIPWAGFDMMMFGNPAETISYASAAGMGAADTLQLNLDVEAQIGSTITFTVTDMNTNGVVASTMWASALRVDVDLSPLFGLDAHLLCDYNSRAWENTSASGTHTTSVPPVAGGGMTWYTQAAVGAAGVPAQMSNGLAHYIH